MLYKTGYSSPLDQITIVCDHLAIKGLWIEGQQYFEATLTGEITDLPDHPLLLSAKNWLDRYFAGAHPQPGELPLAPEGSPFRQRVWRLLQEIPYGQACTYGALAKRLGEPRTSPRAVGGAVGHNPISIIIPCHRILGAGGALTGYAGGLDRKRWLLEHEGIPYRK